MNVIKYSYLYRGAVFIVDIYGVRHGPYRVDPEKNINDPFYKKAAYLLIDRDGYKWDMWLRNAIVNFDESQIKDMDDVRMAIGRLHNSLLCVW